MFDSIVEDEVISPVVTQLEKSGAPKVTPVPTIDVFLINFLLVNLLVIFIAQSFIKEISTHANSFR